jgi:SNF2 family DNA or RNA helicase
MLVLHAGLRDDSFLVWAESSTPTRSRRQTGATADELRDALQKSGIDTTGTAAAANALLPTRDGRTIPSSPLLGNTLIDDATLQPWQLKTIELDGGATTQLLMRVAGERLLAPGVLIGHDLAWWSTAMRYAAALVGRGHVIPSLVRDSRGTFARWLPAMTGDEPEQMLALIAAMPAVARVLGDGESAERATTRFVERFVDRAMRDETQPARRTVRGNPQQLWTTALLGSEARVDATDLELTKLAAAIESWLRPVTSNASAPFRLTFRLDEPRAENEQVAPRDALWRIVYLLQSRSDPSLLVPASLLLDATGGNARKERIALEKLLSMSGGADPREVLLRSLGEAAAVSTAVEQSLHAAQTAGYVTDTDGAYAFLSNDAAALESAGFRVLLPSWWSRRNTKPRLTLRGKARSPKFTSASGLSLDSIVDVDWSIAIGDTVLTARELNALAKLKSPLVNVRGQWVQLSSNEIEDALRYWKRQGSTSLQQLVRARLTSQAPESELYVESIAGDGAIGELLARLDGTREWEELPEPEGFRGELRPYQKRGYSWLQFLSETGLGACLADDMGLGKTVQTLALAQRDWQRHHRPLLLLCPTSVTGNWLREAQRFTPELPVLLHHGADRARGDALRASIEESALVITSYSLVHRDSATLGEISWRGVVLDEAQNIKNSETKQARAARALHAGFRIALTGTPVENNVGDLWSIMEFLNPGLLGSAESFRKRFYLPIQMERDPSATERLHKLTRPFILRRLKSDKSIIADLPEKNEMKVFCTLTKEQASLYQAVVQDVEETMKDAEGIERKGLILATLTRLKQVCDHPALFLGDRSELSERSGKLTRLTEMLGEAISVSDRALVFTQYAEMGKLLQTHLAEHLGVETLLLYGGTPRAQRDAMVERFQNEENGPAIFVLSLKAGGTGLNLTRANHVFHFDRWWNPAVENQATDRAYRIGQTKNVQVHKLICAGTLEEKIDAMIETKQQLASSVVGSGEGWLTELSDTQLTDLFALRADAVGE